MAEITLSGLTGFEVPDATYTGKVLNTTTNIATTESITFEDNAAVVTVPDSTEDVKYWAMIEGSDYPNTGAAWVEIVDGVAVIQAGKITIDGLINIVILGDSIMDQSYQNFGSQKGTLNGARAFYSLGGAVVKVFERATSGDTTTDLLVDLPGYLTEFAGQEANTVFFSNIGINNILQGGAYPTASTKLKEEYRTITDMITDAGFFAAGTTITYRAEEDGQILYPTDPYNINDINPLVKELMPAFYDTANDKPYCDLYTAYYDARDTAIKTDGVHPTEDVGRSLIRDTIGQAIGSRIIQTNAPTTGMSDVVISFSDYPSAAIPNVIRVPADTPVLSDMVNIDGENVLFASVTTADVGRGTLGNGNAGDDSSSLTNDGLLKTFLYSAAGITNTLIVDPDTYDETGTYTVSVTASRNLTSGTITDFTIGGVTKTLDAGLIPAEILTWTGVTKAQLVAGVIWGAASGSSNGYFNGIRITRE